MAVEVPEPLQWVLLLLAGTRWPDGDEDQLREMAARWRETAEQLEDAGHAADAAMQRALDGQQGAAAEALTTYWSQYTTGSGGTPGYFPGTAQACNGMGDMLEQMANSIETAKIQIIAQLGILAFEIATAEAEAPFTFGASLAEIPVAVGISRTVVQQVLKKLLQEALKHAAKQAAIMGGINLMAQTIEIAEGHRKSLDLKELGQNVEGGAVAGALGHGLGKGVGAAGAKAGLGKAMGSLPGRMATGAAVGVGTDAGTQLITTGNVDSDSLLGSGLNGAGGVAAHAGAGAVRNHFSGPPEMNMPHVQPAEAGGVPAFSNGPGGGAESAYHGLGDADSSLTPDGGAGSGPSRNSLVPFGSPLADGAEGGSPTALHGQSSSLLGDGPSTFSQGGSSLGDEPSALSAHGGSFGDGPSTLSGHDASLGDGSSTSPDTTPSTGARQDGPVADASGLPVADHGPEAGPHHAEAAPAPDADPAPVHRDEPAPDPAPDPTRSQPEPQQQPEAAVQHDAVRPGDSEPADLGPAAGHGDASADGTSHAPAPDGGQPRPEPVGSGPAPAAQPVVGDHQQVFHDPGRVGVTAPDLSGAGAGLAPRSAETAPGHQVHDPGDIHIDAAQVDTSPQTSPSPTPAASDGTSTPPAANSGGVPGPSGFAPGAGDAGPASHTGASGAQPSAAPPVRSAPPSPSPGPATAPPAGQPHTPAPGPSAAAAPPPMATTPGRSAPPPPTGTAPTPSAPSPTPSHSATPHPSESAPGQTPRPAATGGPTVAAVGLFGGGPRAGRGAGPSPSAGGREDITTRQQRERQEELDRLRNSGQVRHTADALGREQRMVATKPPQAEELVRDLPSMSPEERAQTLESLRPEYRRWLAKEPALVDALRDGLPRSEFAATAARLIVHVPEGTEQPASARQEAQAQVARMLQDPDTAARLLKNGAQVTVVPKDIPMTDVQPFRFMRDSAAEGAAGGGRSWADVRGSGGHRTAVTEENLLGGDTSVGDGGHYHDGYSTTTHEFAHTLHRYGLTPEDQAAITQSYEDRRGRGDDAPWPDGTTDRDESGNAVENYSSRDEDEYFAQMSNAYLGTNHGTDPYTGQERNNGADWVRTNAPELVPLMERLYGADPSAVHSGPSNPVEETRAENDMYDGLRDFTQLVEGTPEGSADPAPAGHDAPPPTGGPSAATPHDTTPHGTTAHDTPHPPPAQTTVRQDPAAARANGEYVHTIAAEHALNAIDGFLDGSGTGHAAEFRAQRAALEGYQRADLRDGDTAALLAQHRQRMELLLDVLKRGGEHDATIPDDWRSKVRDTYTANFADHAAGPLRTDPHAEKVALTDSGDGKVSLQQADVNRNHIIADTMLHKYVTAAVFKARTLDAPGQEAAGRAFQEFSETIPADSHRMLDGRTAHNAEKKWSGTSEAAALLRRDLAAYRSGNADYGSLYGLPGLHGDLAAGGRATDAPSAGRALDTVRDTLAGRGLDGPLEQHLSAVRDSIDRLASGESDLATVHDRFDRLQEAARAQALDDLALVNGVTAHRELDDTAAVLDRAADHGDLGDPATRSALAGRLDGLAGTFDRVGHTPAGDLHQRLTGHAEALRDPSSPPPTREELRRLAADLAGERPALHEADLSHTEQLAGRAVAEFSDRKAMGAPAANRAADTAAKAEAAADKAAASGRPADRKAADRAADKAAAAEAKLADQGAEDLRQLGDQIGGAHARSGPGSEHPMRLFEQALTLPAADLPAHIAKITDLLSNNSSNLRFGDADTNQWIQNFLDPQVTRDPDLLTGVTHGQLPPEALYTPHTQDVLRGVRVLEDAGLVPPGLGDMMAPKTEAELDLKGSASLKGDHQVPGPGQGHIPVSSSGDFAQRPGTDRLGDEQVRTEQGALGGHPQPDRHADPMDVDTPPHSPAATEDHGEPMDVDPPTRTTAADGAPPAPDRGTKRPLPGDDADDGTAGPAKRPRTGDPDPAPAGHLPPPPPPPQHQAGGTPRALGDPSGSSSMPRAGRTGDEHLSPPPPPQHQAGGTPRALRDPSGSSSMPRAGRTGDEHLSPPPPPPPPPSGNSRIRPTDEPPTRDELTQLHQHPSGPALIHPPAADAAALAQYKSSNRFNFKLTGELNAAANILPHSSWGRHDSGTRLPDGRPDVKVSPYSQSFKSHLDPLTLKALHPHAANAVIGPLRNELGPDAMAFSGNRVLEAAGNLDFRTQEHFRQQEIRRNVLERLARQDSEQTWHPVGEQRVNDHLNGSTSAMDGVNRLLSGDDGHPGFDGFVLGEAHSQSPSWRFLNENMHDLKAAGVDRIYVESLRDDAFQKDLDAFQRGGTMSPNLERMLRTYDSNMNSPAGHGLYDTVVRAREEGVTIHAVDGYPARRPHEGGPLALQERARLLNSYMKHAITDGGGSGKYVLVTGKAHVHEHASSTDHRIPGVAEMLGVPAVRLIDAGRPDPVGSPHDATAATDPSNMRLGYLAPASTGHAPANPARQHGNGNEPAPSVTPHPSESAPRGAPRSSASEGPAVPAVGAFGGGPGAGRDATPEPSAAGHVPPPPPAPPTGGERTRSAGTLHPPPPTNGERLHGSGVPHPPPPPETRSARQGGPGTAGDSPAGGSGRRRPKGGSSDAPLRLVRTRQGKWQELSAKGKLGGQVAWDSWKDMSSEERGATPAYAVAEDLSQRDLHHLIDHLASAGEPELAGRLRDRARQLDLRARQAAAADGEPGAAPTAARTDQVIWTGAEIQERSQRLEHDVAELQRAMSAEGVDPHVLAEQAARVRRSADELSTALGGFVKDASALGGTYALRDAHAPLAAAARNLADAALRPPDPDRRPVSPETLRGLADAARDYRARHAYAEVPTGEQWKAVLPELDGLSKEERAAFVRDLSRRNLESLRSDTAELLEQPEFRDLYERLRDLPYRLKHATPAYHAIANSGVMSSQGDLGRRGARFLASGKSSASNTSNLGNDDFVFFRVEANDRPMQTRYGPTTMIFRIEELERLGGWVSLHDQLHPLDRPAMQALREDGQEQPVRTSAYAEGTSGAGSRARWVNTYPAAEGEGRTQGVSFEQEVFHGGDVRDGIALSVVREVARIGGGFQQRALGLESQDALSDLVSSLYRPEAKFGSGLPVDLAPEDAPRSGWPRPVDVVNPDGDGRYHSDGTLDPAALAASKEWGEFEDRRRQADTVEENRRRALNGIDQVTDEEERKRREQSAEANGKRAVGYLKPALKAAEEAVRHSEASLANAPEERRELAARLLEERRRARAELSERLNRLQQELRGPAPVTGGGAPQPAPADGPHTGVDSVAHTGVDSAAHTGIDSVAHTGVDSAPAGGPAPSAVAAPANPDGWAERRAEAPSVSLHAERPTEGGPALVRSAVRRFQADNGQWVRDFTVTLPFAPAAGIDPARLTGLRARVQNALDRHVNTGLALPHSGDQLHVTVRMVHAEGHGERITLSDSADPQPADQRRWDLGHDDAVLMHQALRYLGMPGEGGPLLRTHLAVIEEVCDSAALLRSHPLPQR